MNDVLVSIRLISNFFSLFLVSIDLPQHFSIIFLSFSPHFDLVFYWFRIECYPYRALFVQCHRYRQATDLKWRETTMKDEKTILIRL